MENWLKPLRRFYASDDSRIDYATTESGHVDAVLEVAAMLDTYQTEDVWQAVVFVRLIDPRANGKLLAKCMAEIRLTGP